jgi:peptide/nickel transport system substrate-binding protein
LDPKARFADGNPVLPEDVLFSWRLLRDKGRPNHRSYYSKVTRAEKIGERSVRFDFGGEPDRELPLILGLMPVLPRHAVDEKTFEETTLSPMLGSGPYQVAEVRPGESVLLRRDPNYWGRDLAVNRGHYNFDELRFDFFRDGNTWFEAFKRGLYDVRFETDPGRWAAQYDVSRRARARTGA